MSDGRQYASHGGNIYSVWSAHRQRRVYRYQKKWFNPESGKTVKYTEEVLEWWQATGKLRLDWPLTVQNWIRKLERGRLTRLARAGSEEAKLALRWPKSWAERYDRKQKAVQSVVSTGGEGLIRPSGGTVIRLKTPGRR